MGAAEPSQPRGTSEATMHARPVQHSQVGRVVAPVARQYWEKMHCLLRSSANCVEGAAASVWRYWARCICIK